MIKFNKSGIANIEDIPLIKRELIDELFLDPLIKGLRCKEHPRYPLRKFIVNEDNNIRLLTYSGSDNVPLLLMDDMIHTSLLNGFFIEYNIGNELILNRVVNAFNIEPEPVHLLPTDLDCFIPRDVHFNEH